MKRLPVDGEDCHPRAAIELLVEGADFHDDDGMQRTSNEMRATFGAELPVTGAQDFFV